MADTDFIYENAEVFEQLRFSLDAEKPLGSQLLEIAPRLIEIISNDERARVREIVVIIERET